MTFNILKYNVETSFCIGDLHGEFKSLTSCIKRYEIKNCLLLCCGDIGLGFEKEQHYKNIFTKLNKLCKQQNVYIIFIRGNHDDPYYFDNNKIKYSNIIAIQDYTVVQIFHTNDEDCLYPLHSILCVGGATSIDRTLRLGVMEREVFKYRRFHNCSEEEARIKCKKFYWENEHPYFNKVLLNEIKNQNINIDIVCTHTCPSIAQPVTKDGIQYWCLQDKTLEEDINTERTIMDNILNQLKLDEHKLTHWIYGHYHYRNNEIIDGVKYIMLDMMRNGNYDYYEIKNID